MTTYDDNSETFPSHPLHPQVSCTDLPQDLKCPDAPIKEQKTIARTMEVSDETKVNFALPMKRKRDSDETFFIKGDDDDADSRYIHYPHFHVQQMDVDNMKATSAKKRLDFVD